MDVDELTLAEKASLCRGADFWHTVAVARLGVERIMVADGPHGLRVQHEGAEAGLDASEEATCFPTACALASSWNAALFADVGAAIGVEARALGVSVVLGPGINIKRNPLCGRNFEYLSEDPWLAGVLAAAMVGGIQSQDVGACVKHFAVNNQETDRARVSADVDDRALREIYLPAFEHVVAHASPWTVMCSYNKINGIYASEHHWLLTEVLRGEWGFDGLVMSDWGAVHDRVAALAAGLDLEMPPNLDTSDAAVIAAVQSGDLPVEVLDATVRRVLALVERSAGATPTGVDHAAHHDLARRAAQESAVLLRNEGAVLPLLPEAGQKLAVIGEFARTPRFQGAGSSQVSATRVDVALDELRAGVPDGVEVAFAPGFTIDGADVADASRDDVSRDDASRDASGSVALGDESAALLEEAAALREEAVALAGASDHVVMFLGLPSSAESEGFDRDHMDLPANQTALLEAVTAVHDRVVVVLANGSAVRVSGWSDRVAAILECWLSGQAAGGAAADLLLGAATPSGKLAETIPLRLQDSPSFLSFPGDSGHVRYGEGVFVGYRGHDRRDDDVSYPFGHGLSYTTFTIGDVETSVSGSVAAGNLAVEVAVTVTNTGDRAGAEVVQVYVHDVEATHAVPVRELKAFTKVTLAAGESRRVSVTLDERSFSHWSTRLDRWAVEAGVFEIAVGSSSRDLAAPVTVTIEAPSIRPPLGPMSTLEEWLADDEGRALFTKDDTVRLPEPDLMKVIGSMPVSTIAAFPGLAFDRHQLDGFLREVDGGER